MKVLDTYQGLDLWATYSPQTQRYDVVDPQYCPPGTTVVRLFWCQCAGVYVSIPGASLYTVLPTGATRLVADEGMDAGGPHHDAHRATA